MEIIEHCIAIPAGQDIGRKIMSFTLQCGRAVYILYAHGFISVATLTQPLTSGSTLTFEGKFEIVSLSGFYVVTDSDGSRNRRGRLCVVFATPDSQVKGGAVAGRLIAASPVEVIVGSFLLSSSMIVNISPMNAQENDADSNGRGLHHPHTPGRIRSNQ